MKRIMTISLLALMAATFIACEQTDVPTEDEIPESDIPVIPADPQEGSTDFKHRMLLIQHTGTACGYCPEMISCLSELSELPEYNDAYNLVAVHAYNPDDKAYTDDAVLIESEFGVGGFPALTFNLTTRNAPQRLANIKQTVDEHRKEKADIGIAAASKVTDGKVVVRVEVKGAVENVYRISVWLLQDNIYAKQKDYNTGVFEDWMNYHNNCLMKMAGNGNNTKVYGRNIGTVAAGTKIAGNYSIAVDKAWDLDKCKLLILANGQIVDVDNPEDVYYDVSNSVICPINGSVAYDYISE